MPDDRLAPEQPVLAPNHLRLVEGSAISPEVAAARGYRTVTTKAELERLGFANYQRNTPALLISVYNVYGELATYQARPDSPRISKGKALKYETPAGTRMVLDVPPAARPMLANPNIPLFVTEGVRKADAAVSAGLCCIALLGVWNWRGRNDEGGLTALADWESIALKGRRAYVVFDSDVMEKEAVHAALQRLKRFLESRGADVRLIYLPGDDRSTKVGLDDFLAAGHSTDDLLALAAAEVRPIPRGETSPPGAADRPEIVVTGRYMREISDEAVQALLASQAANPEVFLRGTVLVRLRRDHGTLLAEPLEVASLRGALDRTADFVKVDGDSNASAARPPLDVVQDILTVPDPPFPTLGTISTIPRLLPGGALITTSGYHPESRVLFDLGALEGLEMVGMESARDLIVNELLGDFPFADNASRAHAVALLLQPFVRQLFPGPTPLYLIDAPARGTGKGLLADVIARVTLGRPAPVVAPTHDGDELEKRITSLLIAGSSFVLLDNVTGLRAPALAAALTAEVWEARLLGKSQMLRLPNEANWVATGNNVELSDELARRVIPIRLDAACAAPEERSGFRHPDLPRWVRDRRTRLVSACVALIRHWVEARKPRADVTLGRFEGWAAIMGGILKCNGIPGFLGNRSSLRSFNYHETQEWTAVCSAWHETFDGTPVTAGRLMGLLRERQLLLDIWAGRSELSGQQRLGHSLAQRRDRVFGSYVVREAGRDSATRNAAYKLEYRRGPGQKHPETPETPAAESTAAPAGTVLSVETPQNTLLAAPAQESGPGVSGVWGVSPSPDADEQWEEV